MIYQYNLNNQPLTLSSDLACEFPIYLYLSTNKQLLLYSKSINNLLNDKRIPKPLKVSDEGLSFLLQNGVVPPPKTAYENIFILGIGDTVKITTKEGKLDLTFKHQFPFSNTNRLTPDEFQADEDLILKLIAEATIERIDKTKPTYLFQSLGKDSNTIALALSEAGFKDKITLITHQSKGDFNETYMSKKIANRLGFKHETLHEPIDLNNTHKQSIKAYFESAPFPVTDNATLAYPLYLVQKPELKNCNIIDGNGNDIYMGIIPSSSDFIKFKLAAYFSKLRILTKYTQSESFFNILGRSRSEWIGLAGLSYLDAKKIFIRTHDTSPYWLAKVSNKSNTGVLDSIDFVSDEACSIIVAEIGKRKVRNFANAFNSNLIMPFTNKTIAEYFALMPEVYLFDRKTKKNKLILRKILKERIKLDSDKIGKFGYTFDFMELFKNNLEYVSQEILCCPFWSPKEINVLFHRLNRNIVDNNKRANFSAYMIHRLFVISLWLNNNKYINTKHN